MYTTLSPAPISAEVFQIIVTAVQGGEQHSVPNFRKSNFEISVNRNGGDGRFLKEVAAGGC
jgi:hypothetical protein